MGLAKKVVICYNDKPVKGLIVQPGQKMWKVNVHTHKVDEIPLLYDMTRVDFDMDYFYCPATNANVALDKCKREEEKEKSKKKFVN